MICTQQAAQNADGGLKKVHIFIDVKIQRVGHPVSSFIELCKRNEKNCLLFFIEVNIQQNEMKSIVNGL